MSIWNDPKIDARLAQLWEEGFSCEKIARTMTAEFRWKTGKPITKNAVIGRVHRRGLPMRGWAANGQMSVIMKRAKAGKAFKPGPQPKNGPPKRQRKPQAPFQGFPLAEIPPDPKRASPVSWADLTDKMCKRVIGEVGKGHKHCGQPVIPGQAWCPACRTEVYMPIEVSRRRRVRINETEQKIAEVRKLMEQFG